MEQELQQLNEIVSNYMIGDDTYNENVIINKASELYAKYGNDLPDILKEIMQECNNIQNQTDDYYSVIEDLCGYLAEYFDF